MEHVVVFAEKGRFAGWPANNGAWLWDGQEILVGCTTGSFAADQPFHRIRPPFTNLLCRSRDGGRTWRTERPAHFVGTAGELTDPPRAWDFTAPGFAVRVVGDTYHGSAEKRGGFFVSGDRGAHWEGPYAFRGLEKERQLEGMIITARTDYVVEGRAQGLFMLSATRETLRDRVFCARTEDGGQTFTFAGWMVPPSDPWRGVMPSTARCADGSLVAAVRRRRMPDNVCWIDAYASADGGAAWQPLGKVGETGAANGNPPALARLADGRLCCAYGRRDRRQMVARVSGDRGRTWGEETVIRDDFPREGVADFGYPRILQRGDGRIVVIYYWATGERPEQHIAATIW